MKKKVYLIGDTQIKGKFIKNNYDKFIITEKLRDADICFVLGKTDMQMDDEITKIKEMGIEIKSVNEHLINPQIYESILSGKVRLA